MQKLIALMLILVRAGWSVNNLAQDGWEQMEDMNIEKSYFRSCLLENRIYIFGGEDKDGYGFSPAEVYDINTNKWITLAGMPEIVSDAHVCEVKKRIYIIGGWNGAPGTFYISDLNYEYNPELDVYTVKKSCPSITASSPSCTLNNKIYIFGIRDSITGKPQKKVFRYDPANDNWETLPDMNFEHSAGNAVNMNNKIYVIGGGIEHQLTYYFLQGKLEMYDPETNSWTVLKDMPVPVANHANVVHDNKILVFGGDSAHFIYPDSYGSRLIQEYDPSTDTWRVMEGMPFYRFAFTAQEVNNNVYIIGGGDSLNHAMKEVWRFDLNCLKPTTSINEPVQYTSPIFVLHQNYPNPFSGSTKISYELKEPCEVKLNIIDIFGQEITSLVHEMKGPGSYSLNWDTKAVKSGIYFCRLKVGDLQKVIKLMVLK